METTSELVAGPVAPGALEEILDKGLLRSLFQPIVDLETRVLFGYEALARGPAGSEHESPQSLFAAAAAEGRLVELDSACQTAAVAGALTHGFASPLTLFVNVEPDTIGVEPLPAIGPGLRTLVELTERTLASRLADLLPALQRARAQGWGVALDDVGADTRSLALMPLLRPDVIKLDLRLVQQHPTPEIAAIVGAVGEQAERSGATVLAEGIETEEQAEYARALGATLGQGYLFGVPADGSVTTPVTTRPLPIHSAVLPHAWRTPFELASPTHPVRRGSTRLVSTISRQLELQAASLSRTSLLISTFPDVGEFSAHMTPNYAQLAATVAFAAALAHDMPDEPSPNLRGFRIADDDPLRETWNVIVLGPHYASMIAARRRSLTRSPDGQAFDFVFTYDRKLIIECAQALTLRIGLVSSRPPSAWRK
jgi:EAL domain-containing protein (putative c-di-GMP-specific phosphodiesterase class I)